MDNRKAERFTQEICSVEKGLLKYASEINTIVNKIYQSNCQISLWDEPYSVLEREIGKPNRIRISKKNKKEVPVHFIWDILHEYGHHLSGTLKNGNRTMSRERLAWEFAEKELNCYPDLIAEMDEFHKYKFACLKSYINKNLTNDLVSIDFLFHYTPSLKRLKEIICNGFKPSVCLEDRYYLRDPIREFANSISVFSNRTENERKVEYEKGLSATVPMVCFCDIPLSLIRNHALIYGSYAIGLTKEWGIKNQISPLLYLPNETIPAMALTLFKALNDDFNSESNLRFGLGYKKVYAEIIPFTKPYQQLDDNNKRYPKGYKYYDEREWRYFGDSILSFSSTDLKFVIVEDQFEVTEIKEILFEKFGKNDVYVGEISNCPFSNPT